MNDLVKHLPRNEVGRDFVAGDIHGEFDALRKALTDVSFNESVDRLFSVGDLVDRGSQSEESINWITKPWFHAVRGNHEQMVIDFSNNEWPADNYIYNGGGWFVNMSDERQNLFAEIFETLPIMIEIDHQIGKVGIVHAEVPCFNWKTSSEQITAGGRGDRSLPIIITELNAREKALWSRKKFTSKDTSIIEGVERVYVGHTPLKEWIVMGNVYYIDTGSVFGNKLTLLEIK